MYESFILKKKVRWLDMRVADNGEHPTTKPVHQQETHTSLVGPAWAPCGCVELLHSRPSKFRQCIAW